MWCRALTRAIVVAGVLGPALAAQQDPDSGGTLPRPDDFREFWRGQLDTLQPVTFSLTEHAEQSDDQVTVFELKYPSVEDGSEVWGWFSVPAHASADNPVPTVLRFPGFGGHRGPKAERLPHACFLQVGYRGHGEDRWPADWIARGLESPRTSVFRIHYLNAVRALHFLQTRAEVDQDRIFATGQSLGGGMAIAVAGLVPDAIAGIAITKPGMAYYFAPDGHPVRSDFTRVSDLVAAEPERAGRIRSTLNYHAQIHFAPEVTAPAIVCAGGLDTICTPAMVRAVFEALGSDDKQLRVYPKLPHGRGPGMADWNRERAAWLAERIKNPRPVPAPERRRGDRTPGPANRRAP